jgi:hypothetical protein
MRLIAARVCSSFGCSDRWAAALWRQILFGGGCSLAAAALPWRLLFDGDSSLMAAALW